MVCQTIHASLKRPTQFSCRRRRRYVVVNVGSVVVDNKLVAVTAETKWPGEDPTPGEAVVQSKVTHLQPEHDPDTGYNKPNEIAFDWKGKSLISDASGEVSAHLRVNLGTVAKPRGLMEKVDVLAEIPYVLKMAVSYVAGTKPYIYQVCLIFIRFS